MPGLQVYIERSGVFQAIGRSPLGSYNPVTFSYGTYGSYKPSASTTGIPAGSPALTVQSGTSGIYNVTTGGTYDLIDFQCEVQVRTTANVTFSRCKFRGNTTRSSNGALLNCGSLMGFGFNNVKIYDCEFKPTMPSIWWDAIFFHDYEAHRCKISGTVDAFGAYGSGSSAANVAIYGCYTDLQAYFSPDPNHPGDTPVSKTHNDIIQWQGGANLTAVGNNFHGYIDPAVGDANYSSSSPNASGGGPNNSSAGSGYNVNYPNMQVDGGGMQVSGTNGGECSGMDVHNNWWAGCNRILTLSQAYTSLGTIHDNIVDHDQLAGVCFNIPTGMDTGGSPSLVLSNNTYSNDGSAVLVYHT